MEPIKNIDKYTSGMRKSLIDKIFFVDKVPSDFAILDFGCADGTLLEFLYRLFNEANHYVGYDINLEMISKAKQKELTDIYFDTDWDDAYLSVENAPQTTKVLLLSSIIHEIYSYSSSEEIDRFWKRDVFNDKFTHIVIRDMIPSSTVNRATYDNDVRKVVRNSNPDILSSFESRWGSITNFKNLMHYFLKYRYKENWEREVRENYLSLSLEDLYKLIPNNYDIIYQEHYCLPFLHETIKTDFNIDFHEPTHLKVVLKRH